MEDSMQMTLVGPMADILSQLVLLKSEISDDSIPEIMLDKIPAIGVACDAFLYAAGDITGKSKDEALKEALRLAVGETRAGTGAMEKAVQAKSLTDLISACVVILRATRSSVAAYDDAQCRRIVGIATAAAKDAKIVRASADVETLTLNMEAYSTTLALLVDLCRGRVKEILNTRIANTLSAAAEEVLACGPLLQSATHAELEAGSANDSAKASTLSVVQRMAGALQTIIDCIEESPGVINNRDKEAGELWIAIEGLAHRLLGIAVAAKDRNTKPADITARAEDIAAKANSILEESERVVRGVVAQEANTAAHRQLEANMAKLREAAPAVVQAARAIESGAGSVELLDASARSVMDALVSVTDSMGHALDADIDALLSSVGQRGHRLNAATGKPGDAGISEVQSEIRGVVADSARLRERADRRARQCPDPEGRADIESAAKAVDVRAANVAVAGKTVLAQPESAAARSHLTAAVEDWNNGVKRLGEALGRRVGDAGAKQQQQQLRATSSTSLIGDPTDEATALLRGVTFASVEAERETDSVTEPRASSSGAGAGDAVFQEELGPEPDDPIRAAGHRLKEKTRAYQSDNNDVIKNANQIVKKFTEIADSNKADDKKGMIEACRSITKQAELIAAEAKKVAESCGDSRLKVQLQQVSGTIPMLCTQMRIICAVKAGSNTGNDNEQLAMCTQNLSAAIAQMITATELAQLKSLRKAGNAALVAVKWRRKALK